MKNKLLILDLDECLFHSVYETEFSTQSYYFLKNSFEVLGGKYRTMFRPHLQEFLRFAFKNFDVAVWTAAGKEYAEFILNEMELDTTKLQFFYTEKNCTPKYDYGEGWGMGHYVYKKNITKLSKMPEGYDMNKVLMVDDKPEHIDSYGNVIKIPPFYGDTNDTYLLKLKEYLKEIKDEPNYRKIEKRGWSN
jgi:RNA polymerase II subunit A small phosphatase-like protein